MPQRRPHRLDEATYVGRRQYFLTLCTHERRPIFTDAILIDVVTTQILRAATTEHFDLIAYCFMPDHLHLLVRGKTGSANLRVFAHRAKQLSGYHGRRISGQRIWQTGIFDRMLGQTDVVAALVVYILENPVHANLAEHPRDYPFVGSTVYTREELLGFVPGAPAL
jgi:putative transposase